MTNDLLEQRAQGGTPRGAADIWAGAHNRAAGGRGRSWNRAGASRSWFRLAVGLAVIALGAAAVNWPRAGQPTAAGREEDRSAGPDQILIDGMDLVGVLPPLESTAGVTTFSTTGDGAPARWQVFARPQDPLAGPILAIENLDGGGFDPRGANLGDRSLSELTSLLVRQGDSWAIDPDSGLEQVADLTGDTFLALESGWQFDFENGADTATWQAEPHTGDGVWVWLVRLLGRGDQGSTLTPTTVLGQPGLVLEGDDGGTGARQVVWEDDQFVYRLTAGELEGDVARQRDATAIVSRLRPVDRATWEAAVDGAQGLSLGETFSLLALLAALVAAMATSLYFGWRGPRLLAPLGPLAVLLAWAVVTPGASTPLTVVVALAVGAAWWYRSTRRAGGEPPPPSP
jgi:hypothetical protein